MSAGTRAGECGRPWLRAVALLAALNPSGWLSSEPCELAGFPEKGHVLNALKALLFHVLQCSTVLLYLVHRLQMIIAKWRCTCALCARVAQ